MGSVRKVVIAVAGYGTRFLPATKAIPKEMMPIVDRPIVQYLVEEAVAAGITDVVLVVRAGAHSLADHFDSSRELEAHLAEQHKEQELSTVRELSRLANIITVRQGRHLPYGNGTPILAAKGVLSPGEPFAFMFGDDLVLGPEPCLKQLVDTFHSNPCAGVIAAQEVADSETSRYGIVKLRPSSKPPEMDSIVEKPKAGTAPSRLAQFGRFVLSYRVVELLESTHVGPGDELYLTHALAKLCQQDRVLVESVRGAWLTTGDPLNFLKATVEFALQNPKYAAPFAEYLRTRMSQR